MFVEKHVLYLSEKSTDNAIGFHIEGRLSEEDVKRYRSVTEGTIAQFGKVKLLFAVNELSGRELKAVWEDLKFTAGYKDDIECIALVGDNRMIESLKKHIVPEHAVEMRHFDNKDYDRAWDWLMN
jgi:hypothetical protein